MKQLNRQMTNPKDRPIKIMQFGEGNFLRAFVDYMVDLTNEKNLFDGSIVIVKPRKGGNLDSFRVQDCQYTVELKGLIHQREYVETRQISSVTDIVSPYEDYEKYIALAKLESLRFVISNTTEAGIVFHEQDLFEQKLNVSFPAKLTQFLLSRYEHFDGRLDKGLVMLPAELIDENGTELKKCIKKYIRLWNLSQEFENWIDEACIFANTLVDRIVTGFPYGDTKEIYSRLGYKDELMVSAEPFALWVIETEKDISAEFPLDKALEGKEGMNVIFTDNYKPYKQRKVRILNGSHTSFVLASWLKGNDVVNQSMKDDVMRDFMMKTIHEEVIPTLSLPEHELKAFADAVVDRFNNPFIKHSLLAISLNSVSKWKARCMPSFLGYIEKFGKLPEHLTFSLAALMAFYTGEELRDGVLIGHRKAEEYQVKDDQDVLEFFMKTSGNETSEFVHAFLSNEAFFGQDLTKIEGLSEQTAVYLNEIRTKGMEAALIRFFG